MTLMPHPLQVVYPVAKEGDYNVNITWNGKYYCDLSCDLLICTVENGNSVSVVMGNHRAHVQALF